MIISDSRPRLILKADDLHQVHDLIQCSNDLLSQQSAQCPEAYQTGQHQRSLALPVWRDIGS